MVMAATIMSAPNLRICQHADGRISFPDVVDYEIIAGEHAGLRLPLPPRADEYPHPDIPKSGAPYLTHVHDREIYNWLRDTGRIATSYGKHDIIDNRNTS